VKTGDADATIWLESKGRSYCLSVASKRLGKFDSKRWNGTPQYLWSVELWVGSDEEISRVLAHGKASTFAAAMRRVRREADAAEQKARKTTTRRKP
jgi:hypothetical protein